MKATIKTQGQQFTVTEGDILVVNRYPNTEAGNTVQITDVLAAGEGEGFKVGVPLLGGASVSAKILENKRGSAKVIVFWQLQRKGYERSAGPPPGAFRLSKTESISQFNSPNHFTSWHIKQDRVPLPTVARATLSALGSKSSAAKRSSLAASSSASAAPSSTSGSEVGVGRDWTLFALKDGVVVYDKAASPPFRSNSFAE